MTATKEYLDSLSMQASDERRIKQDILNHNAELSDWLPAHLKWYNAPSGYGFVVLAEGKEAFLHATVFRASGFVRYAEGMPVEVKVYEAKNRLRVGVLRERS